MSVPFSPEVDPWRAVQLLAGDALGHVDEGPVWEALADIHRIAVEQQQSGPPAPPVNEADHGPR
jgi:hypothetical protein